MIEVEGPDGTVFEFPEGTSREVMRDAMRKKFAAPPRTAKRDLSAGLIDPNDPTKRRSFLTGEMTSDPINLAVERWAKLFAGGFNKQVADVVASLPEGAASLMRTVGLPAPERGTYQRHAQNAMDAMVGPAAQPQNTVEQFIQGAGKGVANAGSVLLPATAVANASRAGTVTGEVARALASAPAMQVAAGAAGGGTEQATDSPLAGIIASLAVPAGVTAAQGAVNRARAPMTSQLDPRRQALANLLEREGVELRPSQATGSKTLRQIEETVGRFPGAIDRFGAQQQRQQGQFTRAVARRMGEDVDAVTPDVLAGARARIGRDFDAVANRTTLVPDQQSAADLQAAINSYTQLLPAQQSPQFPRYVNDVLDFLTNPNNPQMPGAAYQKIRSQITRQIDGMNGQGADKNYQNALRDIRSVMDGLFERQVAAADQDLYKQARGQWSALKTVEGAVARNPGGDLTPNALQTAAMLRRRDQYARSTGQLDELAKAGKEFLPNQIPNSGTPERAFWLGALLTPVGAAGGAATANVAQRAMESPAMRRWLTNQRQPTVNQLTPELIAALLAQNRDRLLPAAAEALPAR